MGILNVTPDSFSDGGQFIDPQRALEQAEAMVAQGADLIDIGGESTRPGATPVDASVELQRIIPVVRVLRAQVELPLSVDTRRASVAKAALDEGVDVVNDISALADPEMAGVVADAAAGLVLMHMRGVPATTQEAPLYDDVAAEVAEALRERTRFAVKEGIDAGRIVIDPGIGFGKTRAHNLELIARLQVLTTVGRPILFGPSRKTFLGALLEGAPPQSRAVGTAAACVIGLMNGARIFRVHDVRIVWEALRVAEAIRLSPDTAE